MIHLWDDDVSVEVADYHTAGGPFRIVPDLAAAAQGQTMVEKQQAVVAEFDDVRRLLAWEPRGHSAMDGAFVTAGVDEGADLGLVLFENGGYSSACGHGTIAATTWAIESGRVQALGNRAVVTIDVPSGRVRAEAFLREGRVESVAFENVASFVVSEQRAVSTSRGELGVAVAFGGAFYALVDARVLGDEIKPETLPALQELAAEIKEQLETDTSIRHPVTPALRGLYGVAFFEPLQRSFGQRNVTFFGDNVADRSPCGSGTCARMAALAAAGEIDVGRRFVSESILGTSFDAWIREVGSVGDLPAVLPTVEGRAHLTGLHKFVLRADDPLRSGFQF